MKRAYYVTYDFSNGSGIGTGSIFLNINNFCETRKYYEEVINHITKTCDISNVIILNIVELEEITEE